MNGAREHVDVRLRRPRGARGHVPPERKPANCSIGHVPPERKPTNCSIGHVPGLTEQLRGPRGRVEIGLHRPRGSRGRVAVRYARVCGGRDCVEIMVERPRDRQESVSTRPFGATKLTPLPCKLTVQLESVRDFPKESVGIRVAFISKHENDALTSPFRHCFGRCLVSIRDRHGKARSVFTHYDGRVCFESESVCDFDCR